MFGMDHPQDQIQDCSNIVPGVSNGHALIKETYFYKQKPLKDLGDENR